MASGCRDGAEWPMISVHADWRRSYGYRLRARIRKRAFPEHGTPRQSEAATTLHRLDISSRSGWNRLAQANMKQLLSWFS